ncbi:Protein FAM98A [Hypsibius exemplaris]|uniref:Protein FAM98A n=1 Tax=Hypsibius exemplaris TaxID=2072580 RepID=A0A9X6RLA8_HYPEX|nr:Protein FAM98A [Hypsibius exemplaris]
MEYASTGAWGSGTPRNTSTSSRSTFMGSTSESSHSPSNATPAVQAKLNFEQAMADFQTMFPDMNPDVIEETLRANQGAVETTIDQLLAMSAGSAAGQIVDVRQSVGVKSSPLMENRVRSRWNPPLVGPLPADFLRLISPRGVRMEAYTQEPRQGSIKNVGQVIDPKRSFSISSLRGGGSSSAHKSKLEKDKADFHSKLPEQQLLEKERKPNNSISKGKVAALSSSPETAAGQLSDDNFHHEFLQNEEFLKELQQDEEFMNALQKDAKVQAGRDNTAFLYNVDGPTPSTSQAGGSQPAVSSSEDGADFQNKLKKNMGLLAKQRLNLFAKQFSRGKKKSPKTILNKATPSSYDQLIEDNQDLVSDDDEDNSHNDHVTEGSAHFTDILRAMEDPIFHDLQSICHGGEDVTRESFQQAITLGTDFLELSKIIAPLCQQLRLFADLQQDVMEMRSPADASAFIMDVSSFLEELECPYRQLMAVPLPERLASTANRLLLLDFLIGELQAARLNYFNNGPESKKGQALSPSTENLKKIVIALNLSAPPPDIDAARLFARLEGKLKETLETAPPGTLGKPLLTSALSPEQWKEVEKINDSMCAEYRLRREMLLKRFDVTVQSFSWSDKAKAKKAELEKVYVPLRKAMSVESRVTAADILAARDDLLRVEKTSSHSVRKYTQCSINRLVMGEVPDRGGRTNETSVPARDMPGFRPREDAGGSRGGGHRGGGRRGDVMSGRGQQRVQHGHFRGGRGGGGDRARWNP